VRESGKDSERDEEIVVFSIVKDSSCSECGVELWKGDFLKMEKGKPLCMECADLDHLVFLSRGDAALTRRSRKHSRLSAVVIRFSRTRGRYDARDYWWSRMRWRKQRKNALGTRNDGLLPGSAPPYLASRLTRDISAVQTVEGGGCSTAITRDAVYSP